ncbi:MAG: signal peptidase II [Spirochaetales bacterium]|nr:signal peptidase II [Spirochaetales bacterium]
MPERWRAFLSFGAGNLVDRFFSDSMILDFILFYLGPFRKVILNITDLSITAGCILPGFTFRPRKRGFISSPGDGRE